MAQLGQFRKDVDEWMKSMGTLLPWQMCCVADEDAPVVRTTEELVLPTQRVQMSFGNLPLFDMNGTQESVNVARADGLSTGRGAPSGGGEPGKPLPPVLSESNIRRLHLLALVRSNDAPGVLEVVADGVDCSLLSEALRLASSRGNHTVARELVGLGLSVNDACPCTGLTSLQLAAAGGHITVCELLLDAMADADARGGGADALRLAQDAGHVEIGDVLTKHMQAVGNVDNTHKRAHVLPRLSPALSEAVLEFTQRGFEPLDDEGSSDHSAIPVTMVAGTVHARVPSDRSRHGEPPFVLPTRPPTFPGAREGPAQPADSGVVRC